ncbi:hypothetical protein BGZ99_005292 [Dissophora globulifera]|uniref:Uncharacterized protein n=1 Tax=Dissophora globulifera TaxID=979702 RepID=A0A9P6RJQ9_9FUNG|nr:hypothetical protein BGZ99_005292 [Dissophora globulifera]
MIEPLSHLSIPNRVGHRRPTHPAQNSGDENDHLVSGDDGDDGISEDSGSEEYELRLLESIQENTAARHASDLVIARYSEQTAAMKMLGELAVRGYSIEDALDQVRSHYPQLF